MDELVRAVKAALLITTDDVLVNNDIESLVNAAIADLRTAGVANICADITSLTTEEQAQRRAFFKRSVVLFCKANFLIDDTQARRAAQAYDAIKRCMSLDLDYKEANKNGC